MTDSDLVGFDKYLQNLPATLEISFLTSSRSIYSSTTDINKTDRITKLINYYINFVKRFTTQCQYQHHTSFKIATFDPLY